MKFFTYDQNNSGGSFNFDAERGITTKVIIEADDAIHADYLATRIGLYFDGSGDCRCCGNRWTEAYGDGFDEPMIYAGCGIEEWTEGDWFMKWMGPNRPEVYVHLADKSFTGYVYGYPYSLRLTESES